MSVMKGESSQIGVKLDAGLHEKLVEFIGSSKARGMGYHSKAQFVTEAVRELLESKTGKNNELLKMVSEIHGAVVK